MRSERSSQFRQEGFSILELLISMSIFTVILLLLSQALEASLSQWTGSTGKSDLRGELRATVEWMRRDFRGAIVERHANLPPLPDTVSDEAKAFLENRWFLPFEIDREQGSTGESESFANAEPGFGQIAFVTRLPATMTGDATVDQMRLGKLAPSPGAADAIDGCLVGYYVAYTRDSPLASSDRSSFKLFRHFRPSGTSLGQGHSRGFVLGFSHLVNDAFDETDVGEVRPLAEPNEAMLRQGKFANRDLPFLFSRRMAEPGSLDLVEAGAPWPTDPPVSGTGNPDLPAPPSLYPPPNFSWERWADPADDIYDYLFPDEPIAHNVVGFECRAFRRVEDEAGTLVLMNATEMNANLGLSGEEWPVLIRPDFVEVSLTIIPPEIAARLDTKADWLGNGSAIATDLIERHQQTLKFQLAIGPAP